MEEHVTLKSARKSKMSPEAFFGLVGVTRGRLGDIWRSQYQIALFLFLYPGGVPAPVRLRFHDPPLN